MHEGLWVRVLLHDWAGSWGCSGDGAVASELAGIVGNGNVLKSEGLSGAAVCSSVMVGVLVSSPSSVSLLQVSSHGNPVTHSSCHIF